MLEKPESGKRGPQQKWEEPETCLETIKARSPVPICELVHANKLTGTHSKATAVGGEEKMKDDVRTHEITKVKERESQWQ